MRYIGPFTLKRFGGESRVFQTLEELAHAVVGFVFEIGEDPKFSRTTIWTKPWQHVVYVVLDSSGVPIPVGVINHAIAQTGDYYLSTHRGEGWPIRSGYSTTPWSRKWWNLPSWYRGGRRFRRYSCILRHQKSMAEKRANYCLEHDEEAREYNIRVRGKRSFPNIPDDRDDKLRSDYDVRSWKKHRKTQWREKRHK